MGNDTKSNQPQNTAFKQQRLPAWQPVLTAKNVLPTFIIVGIVFIPLGAVLLVTSNNCFELTQPYTECKNINNISESCYDTAIKQIENNQKTDCQCEIEFDIDQNVTGPVYFYYKLTNFFQNHRVYVKSRDNKQLSGSTDIKGSNLDNNCEPFKTDANGNAIAPCGTIANSLFNDTFLLYKVKNNNNDDQININKKGIAWKTDHEIKFQNPWYNSGSGSGQQCSEDDLACNFGNGSGANEDQVPKTVKPVYWSKPVYEISDALDMDPSPEYNGYENEALEVWMRTAAFPTFRKLYGTYSDGLTEGKYKILINYNYPTMGFDGTKSFVIAQMTWAGGKNPFLGIAYIVVGSLSLLATIILTVIHLQSRKDRRH